MIDRTLISANAAQDTGLISGLASATESFQALPKIAASRLAG
jgi:hypothetical protein